MLFDTHAHYDDEKYKDDRDEVIRRACKSGVGNIINASVDIASSVESISIAQENDFIYAAVGIHPHNVKGLNKKVLKTLESLAEHKQVVALGEIGLDYYYDNSPRDTQKTWFAMQISLAKKLKLPVIVHDRDSHEDALSIVNQEEARDVGGVFHCFSGSLEMARELLNNNFYISIGGPVTFKNARKAVEVVKYLPNDRLLIETDCPYLSPEPLRGKRNESAYIKYTAQRVAEIKGVSFDKIAQITTENAKRLFSIG